MKLVILDRDGVINHESDEFIKSVDEWHPLPGSLEAIAQLNQAGYRVVVATNQSGIGRGILDMETLNAIHDTMHSRLRELGGHIEAIFYCPHRPEDNCECRKPRPGLLNNIADRLRTPLNGIPVVGDSTRDIEAARAVGAWPLLVRTGRGNASLASGDRALQGVPVYADLKAVADALLINHPAGSA